MKCKYCSGRIDLLDFLLQNRICSGCWTGINHFEQNRTTYDPRKTCKNCDHHHYKGTKKCGVTIWLEHSEREYDYCSCIDDVRKYP